MERLKDARAEQLVYVDECGIDRYLYREYARALRGQKVHTKINGRKFTRVNIMAGICQGKWVAPLQYNGTTDSVLFEFWFTNCLLKEVGKNSIIILDNATFHKKSVLPNLARKYGCEVLFLPPYSPDLNPIEKKWVWLKRTLRNILHNFVSLDDALFSCF